MKRLVIAALVLCAAPASAQANSIVVLDADASLPRAKAVARAHGATIGYTYRSALRGFSTHLTPRARAALRRHDGVDYVERDRRVVPSGLETGAGFGVDRIDQRALPLDQTYSYAFTGDRVTAYVIDTGIRITHWAFASRAANGFDAIDGGTADDCHGHGTQVAGALNQVAKDVSLVAVRVFDCDGIATASSVVAGIDWVTANRLPGPTVATAAFFGRASEAIRDAVLAGVASGITFVGAAGNAPEDACGNPMAQSGKAITVSAIDHADKRMPTANFGPCVDLFAPGLDIRVPFHFTDLDWTTRSGTSMAAAITAGAAAAYLQSDPLATPAKVKSELIRVSTRNLVPNAMGVPNRILYSPPDLSPNPEPARPAQECGHNRFAGRFYDAYGADYVPNRDGFWTKSGGLHIGCLMTGGYFYDVSLQRFLEGNWHTVAKGWPHDAPTSGKIVYEGPPGRYRWLVTHGEDILGSWQIDWGRPR